MELDADRFESGVKLFEGHITSPRGIAGKSFDNLDSRIKELVYATNPLIRECRMLCIICRRLNEDMKRTECEATAFHGIVPGNIPSAPIVLHGYFKNDSSQPGAIAGLLMDYLNIDVYVFYVVFRKHLDSLARIIRLESNDWGEIETSMHDLLKPGSGLSRHAPKFHSELSTELHWVEDKKKLRDDLVHANTYFVPRYEPDGKRIVLELYNNRDLARRNCLKEYDFNLIQEDVGHLVSLYGFLEKNLKFD